MCRYNKTRPFLNGFFFTKFYIDEKKKNSGGSRALVSLASNQLINHNLHDVGINGNRD